LTSPHRDSFRDLLERRLSRRAVVRGAAGLVALAATPLRASPDSAAPLAFTPIAPSRADAVIVPDGYRAEVVLRWGDALFAGATSLDPATVADGALLAPDAAAAQAFQFGTNCDGLGLVALADERCLLCVNHETPSADLMFPGWTEAWLGRALRRFVATNPSSVAYMQAAVGVSVVELERDARGWRPRLDSPLNRRITAHTPMQLAGPAAMHPLFGRRRDDAPVTVNGTLNNCAGGATPWGTYLTAEENVDEFFGNLEEADLSRDLARAYERFGAWPRESLYRWEFADPRFDAARNPEEPLKFGWIVEIDPRDPSRPIKKRTALGRFKHEGATTTLARDGRAVTYMGDDEAFEYFYKFVTTHRFDPEQPERNRDLLDSGMLYVAKLSEDGTGEWLPLVWNDNSELTRGHGFASQADVVVHCREAADRVGATPLDRPEDVAVNPVSGHVYLSCTMNTLRTDAARGQAGADAASPRSPNPSGHILEVLEDGGDPAATRFRWEVFVLAGDPHAGGLLTAIPRTDGLPLPLDATYYGGFGDAEEISALANPDNLGIDRDGNLWIVTDGAQPNGNNNGCFACPTAGEWRGAARQFMSGPVGAEICGCEITPDGRTIFLSVMHPGAGGSAIAPRSHWPDGGAATPRSSLIAVSPDDPARKLGA
jgi:secreted PhoX family phosphatase